MEKTNAIKQKLSDIFNTLKPDLNFKQIFSLKVAQVEFLDILH